MALVFIFSRLSQRTWLLCLRADDSGLFFSFCLYYWVIHLVWQMGLSLYRKTMGCGTKNKFFSDSEYLTVLLPFCLDIAKAIFLTSSKGDIWGQIHGKLAICTCADWPTHAFIDAISKRIKLESWDWSQIKDKTLWIVTSRLLSKWLMNFAWIFRFSHWKSS